MYLDMKQQTEQLRAKVQVEKSKRIADIPFGLCSHTFRLEFAPSSFDI